MITKSLYYFLIFVVCIVFLTCKKKNDGISIQVIDPFLNQPVANSEVSLIEINSGGVFSSKDECKVIKTITTDAEGNAFMENNKFRRREKYDYFLVVSNAYGHDVSYSCSNHPVDDYLPKTKQTITKKNILLF